MVHKRRVPVQHPPEYFDRQEQIREANRGEVVLWGNGTKYEVVLKQARWKEFWKFHGMDPESILRGANPEHMVSYLENYLASRGKRIRRSSLRTKWKRISMWYRQMVGKEIPPHFRRVISQTLSIRSSLMNQYEVIFRAKEKPALYVDDYLEVLSTLWCSPRMQFSCERMRLTIWHYEHLAGYTGNRPGAMVDNTKPALPAIWGQDVTEEPSLPTYRDCKLSKQRGGAWLLEVQINRTKNSAGVVKPNVFRFTQNPVLGLCPIMSFIAHALADDAFAAPDLNTGARILNLRVEDGLRERNVTFKESVLDKPLLPNEEGNFLKYTTLRNYIRKLGQVAGFTQILTTYALRRGVANAINGACSIAAQNQILGHSSGDIYKQHYHDRQVKLDIQNAYMGLPSDAKLYQMADLMSRSIDPRRPMDLTGEEKRTAELSDGSVQELVETVDALRSQIKAAYGFVNKSAGSEMFQQYCSQRQKLIHAKRRAHDEALELKRERHIRSAAIDDVQRQIHGLPSTVPVSPPEISHSHFWHPERARVAAALFSSKLYGIGSREDISNRAAVLDDLVTLCRLREPHHRRNLPRQQQLPAPSSEEDPQASSSPDGTMCGTPTSEDITLFHDVAPDSSWDSFLGDIDEVQLTDTTDPNNDTWFSQLLDIEGHGDLEVEG